ncbi:uncharacterized protein LOC134692334 [Mytilus trossulus]|uniref:uncharacterized protein LOC134692334 n=1 Tax=Mytilus trossulus TaxID=6551 RepID=UPI003004D00C
MIAVPLQNNIRHINRGLNYLRGLKLAHLVTQDESFEISLLIGADYYWDLVEDEVIRGNGPTAVRSKLGFLLSGPVSDKRDNSLMGTSIFNILISHKTEEHDKETFWRLESIGINSKETDIDDTDFLETYQDTSIELRGNKYFAKLPWKQEHDELPSNYTVTRRTENVIKKLSQDPKLLKKYGDIIAEQERRGFVETVDENEQKGGKIHYIPHHPIHKESSTTPIRIVYDCSCRQSPSHPSLNDCLMDTPPKLNDLTNLLVQFRANQFATCTDIEKAFLHVGLSEEDRDVTRFLWLSDPTNPGSQLKTYRFKAVLFGATSSPFILNATIQKHLKQFRNSETAKILERDIYVDNILSSMNKEEDLLTYFKEARSLMAGAGFNLRSWSSNSAKLLELAKEENVLDTDKYTKILGMLWNSRSDEIFYPKRDIPTPELLQHVTKREVLKYSSKIYDPLGLLSPITIRAKIMIQELWKCGLDWDELIPDNLKTTWIDLTKDLEKAIQFTIPRYYFSKPSTSTELVLHVFTDASPKAYGAAAYLSNENETTLVMAKTRVAPVKCLTLPQLELMAAIIGARLAAHLHSTLNYPKIVFWSDSSIVLHWLTSTKTLKRFIANRVREITELTHPYKWRYCPTDNNPADLLTRGLTIEQFDQSILWRKGPHWLTDSTKWPELNSAKNTVLTSLVDDRENEEELDNLNMTHQKSLGSITNILDISNYGSYMKLLRITAYVIRFIRNCIRDRISRKSGPLEVNEIQTAVNTWILDLRGAQHRNTNKVPRVRQLGLFLDETGLIRCNGRIHNAPIPESAKFPYLIPANHPLTRLNCIGRTRKITS